MKGDFSLKVFVINRNNRPLMPCSPKKARILLKENKAIVVKKNPFTIKLLYITRGHTQPLTLGIDTGDQNIGISVSQENKVLTKTEVILRKSMEKKKLINARRESRRFRRYRKVRYRHPKFRHKTVKQYIYNPKKKKFMWMKISQNFESNRKDGWLPPSIQSKIDHHINWINRYLDVLPYKTKLTIEVAKFDIQKIKNPEIEGIDYQKGRMYGYENVKSYVLAKFEYKCPVCKHKFDNEHKPRMHHVTMRKNGSTNNPDEYAPICEKCHTGKNHEDGEVLDKLRKATKRKEYREPTFMNILRLRLFKAFPKTTFTYGNITSTDRKSLGLEKTHANDAVAISMHEGIITNKINRQNIKDIDEVQVIKQVRKKKRSLHEATPRKGRKEPNKTAKRNEKNTKKVTYNEKTYNLYDKVKIEGKIGYITGFSSSNCYVQDIYGNYIIKEGKSYKQIPLSEITIISHNNNWISETKII